MALIELVDPNGALTGATAEREAAYRPSFQGIKPQSHVMLFDFKGQMYSQIRSSFKAAWPGKELPIRGGNPNSRREGDFYANGDKKRRIDYAMVSVNETFEEDGIRIPKGELRRIIDLPRVVNFQELGSVFLAVYWAIYDPIDHGHFNLNPREAAGEILRPRDCFDEIHAEITLGPYGVELMRRARDISEQIELGRVVRTKMAS